MNKRAIVKKANEVLARSGITEPHVDVKKIAADNDIDVKRIELPDEVSGVLQRDDDSMIFINKNHALVRQRFSIAHELGHYFLHRRTIGDAVHIDKKNFEVGLFFRDSRSQQAKIQEEIDANGFAAALLMPRDFITAAAAYKKFQDDGDVIDTDQDVIETLAKQFKVSITAMSLRLQNLGLVKAEL